MTQYYTPDEYVYTCIAQYPILYHGLFYDAKLKVFDHLFNTIGNGITNDYHDIRDHFVVNPDINLQDAYPYVSSESMWCGYTEIKELDIPSSDEKIQLPVYESGIYVAPNAKHRYPQVKMWVEYEWKPFSSPYPNFSKEYSLVWKRPEFKLLGNEWIAAAIKYYTDCADLFRTNAHNCSDAFPPKSERELKDWLTRFDAIKQKYESDDEISKAYGVEYKGDPYDFFCRRWQGEVERRMQFINETIKMLEE